MSGNMIEQVLKEFRTLAETWARETERRRRITAVDPGADAIDYCRQELELVIIDVDEGMVTLDVFEYASLHDVSPATVRSWIRQGKLVAEKGPNGYEIDRDAKKLQRRA